jgi:hypothetical protein
MKIVELNVGMLAMAFVGKVLSWKEDGDGCLSLRFKHQPITTFTREEAQQLKVHAREHVGALSNALVQPDSCTSSLPPYPGDKPSTYR